jgi:hypothetical protein
MCCRERPPGRPACAAGQFMRGVQFIREKRSAFLRVHLIRLGKPRRIHSASFRFSGAVARFHKFHFASTPLRFVSAESSRASTSSISLPLRFAALQRQIAHQVARTMLHYGGRSRASRAYHRASPSLPLGGEGFWGAYKYVPPLCKGRRRGLPSRKGCRLIGRLQPFSHLTVTAPLAQGSQACGDVPPQIRTAQAKQTRKQPPGFSGRLLCCDFFYARTAVCAFSTVPDACSVV